MALIRRHLNRYLHVQYYCQVQTKMDIIMKFRSYLPWPQPVLVRSPLSVEEVHDRCPLYRLCSYDNFLNDIYYFCLFLRRDFCAQDYTQCSRPDKGLSANVQSSFPADLDWELAQFLIYGWATFQPMALHIPSTDLYGMWVLIDVLTSTAD